MIQATLGYIFDISNMVLSFL